jgi:hypothetical protein
VDTGTPKVSVILDTTEPAKTLLSQSDKILKVIIFSEGRSNQIKASVSVQFTLFSS